MSLLIVGCSNTEPGQDTETPADMQTGGTPDAGADTGQDTPDSSAEADMAKEEDPDSGTPVDMFEEEEELRPNVQANQQPNAQNQQPAFPEQTRAPQPAEPTTLTKEVLVDGLEIPWGIAPLPDGRLLVTHPGELLNHWRATRRVQLRELADGSYALLNPGAAISGFTLIAPGDVTPSIGEDGAAPIGREVLSPRDGETQTWFWWDLKEGVTHLRFGAGDASESPLQPVLWNVQE